MDGNNGSNNGKDGDPKVYKEDSHGAYPRCLDCFWFSIICDNDLNLCNDFYPIDENELEQNCLDEYDYYLSERYNDYEKIIEEMEGNA